MTTTVNLEQLSLIPSRAKFPLELRGVVQHDGSPVVVMLQALSFKDRAEAYAAALVKRGKDKEPTFDEHKWTLELARRGIVEPRIEAHHLAILENLNAQIIDQIIAALDDIALLEPRAAEAALAALAGVVPPEKPVPDAQEKP